MGQAFVQVDLTSLPLESVLGVSGALPLLPLSLCLCFLIKES